MDKKEIRKGGSFFIDHVPAAEVFTPEDFGEEHEMIGKTTDRFVKNAVAPHIEVIEHKDFDLVRRLMREAGELGLMGTDIDDRYGGSDLGIIASQLIIERSAAAASFGVTLNVHTGIGSMPLVFFGNSAQKGKYLPALASGEKIGCYALTEPGSGTDALSIQTTATLSPDGKYYRLDGAKQFITNAGFADIIFTYAKVDGDKFTAFIVERDFDGVSMGTEERKMGIRGTSTCSIFLDSALVPVENVLFEIGRGHIVAFNILNLGRFKVAAGCLGMAKQAIESSVGYSKERHQFGRPVCQFGLMKQKIAEMAARTYMAESMIYRTCGLIDTILATVDRSVENAGQANASSIGEYAVECSINKVYCSEMLAYVADEAVQMYGGYGYTEEYPVERIYRDCKIFRIYEGTNEINRIITAGRLMRKALKNEIPIISVAEKLKGELSGVVPLIPGSDDSPLGYQISMLERAKRLLVFLCDSAVKKYGPSVDDEQDILGPLSNIAIEVYAMDSGLLRAVKALDSGGEHGTRTKIDMVQLYINDAMLRITGYAQQILSAIETGDPLHSQLDILRRLSQFTPVNSAQLRNNIADEIIKTGRFTC
ncbi:MAG: acyl-CoA dehydrogenase family protein [Dehalococcoidia bacterium]|nr:MAG: acyl-CoA dehydrogenase family protein [Dehalococcoidia bacterium]